MLILLTIQIEMLIEDDRCSVLKHRTFTCHRMGPGTAWWIYSVVQKSNYTMNHVLISLLYGIFNVTRSNMSQLCKGPFGNLKKWQQNLHQSILLNVTLILPQVWAWAMNASHVYVGTKTEPKNVHLHHVESTQFLWHCLMVEWTNSFSDSSEKTSDFTGAST